MVIVLQSWHTADVLEVAVAPDIGLLSSKPGLSGSQAAVSKMAADHIVT